MLPISLQLHNFMSYATPPRFDFDAITTACFSGENGIGKSAIIDAITWALWGEVSRKISGAGNSSIEPHLLRDGCSEMTVELEFYEGQTRYKVVRAFSNTTKARTTLSIFRYDNEHYTLISSDPPLISTDKEILQQHLRLDYQTFINTAFIRQGNANEFTSKTPAQRKDVLLPLIVPSEYTCLNDAANAEKRRLDEALQTLERRIQEASDFVRETQHAEQTVSALREEISVTETHITEAQTQLATAQEQATQQRIVKSQYDRLAQDHKAQQMLHDQLSSDITSLKSQLQPLPDRDIHEVQANVAQLQSLLEARRSFDENQKHILLSRKTIASVQQAHNTQIHTLQEQQASLSARLQHIHTIIEQKNTILANVSRYQDIERTLQVLENESVTLTQQLLPLASKITTSESELAHLLQRKNELSQEIAVLQTAVLTEDSTEELRSLQDTLETLRHKKDTLTKQQNDYYTVMGQVARLNESKSSHIHTLRTFQERLDNIRSGRMTVCPECGSLLTDNHYTTKLIQDIQECQSNINTLSRELDTVSNHARTLLCENDLAEVVKRIHATEHALDQLQAAILYSEEQTQTMNECQSLLDTCQDQYSQTAQQLLQIQQEKDTMLASLEDLQARTNTARKDLQELAQSVALHTQLQQAMVESDQLTQSLQTLQDRLDVLNSDADYAATITEANAVIAQNTRAIEDIVAQYGTHETMVSAIEELRDEPRVLQNIERITHNNAALTLDITTLTNRLQHAQDTLQTITQNMHALSYDPATLQYAEDRIVQTQATIDRLRATLKDTTAACIHAELLHRQHIERMDELSRLTTEKQSCQHDLYITDVVREVTGRDGIQSALIQTTIERIEEETNRIISLFDPNMTIRFETEKITKTTKQARGTLDIKINTNGEERYYEMYSGGQKYRIDFAIRVAMSSVISLQAGSPLELLIVDEGFGTQDTEGLEAIISVINTLTFPKILVISHVEQLRSAFPVNVHFFQQHGSTTFVVS